MLHVTKGIYTVANDVVFDQLVAWLNSVEVNVGSQIPVYVMAYDDRTLRVKAEIEKRENVTFIDDKQLFKPWEDFSYRAWQGHPDALEIWKSKGIEGVNRIGMNRRYCAFDEKSPADKFVYFDADVLVLNSLDKIFQKLEQNDFVVYDFQYKDPSHIYNINSAKLHDIFPKKRIESEIFCAGFYGGKKGLFNPKQRDFIIEKLNQGDGEILYYQAPNQSLLNYMKMKLNIPVYNFALELPPEEKTGNSVTSSHFEYKNNVLYDKGVRLTYLHYIGVPSSVFTRVCAGENLDFPYRDIFLHYRYLHEPEKMPKFVGKPKPYNPPPTFMDKVLRKLGVNTKKG